MTNKKPIPRWKWAAQVKNELITIDLSGTATAATIQVASEHVRRQIAEQFNTTEQCVIVHKMHQVGGRA